VRSLAGNADGAAGGAEVFAAASEVMAEALENNRQARLPRSVAEPIEAHRGQQARRGRGDVAKRSMIRPSTTTFALPCPHLIIDLLNLIPSQVPFLFEQRVLQPIAFPHASEATFLVALCAAPHTIMKQSHRQATAPPELGLCFIKQGRDRLTIDSFHHGFERNVS
jgi:hypothetical protein